MVQVGRGNPAAALPLLHEVLSRARALVRFNREGRRREKALAGLNQALERANGDLRAALSEVQTLKGLIPICAHCKKIRDDESFLEARATASPGESGRRPPPGVAP